MWMLTISGICPRRSCPAERGRRPLRPQRAVRVQLGQRPSGKATGFTGGLGGLEGIALERAAIARQLTADGAGTAPEQAGDGSLAQTLLDK